ncbi:sigma-54-dependent transcriptional regulator [Desulfomonile tiedjei]|uniref:DNA-binding transcriptional regulator NtrC n=1 Tax=Desulfomonile tiedjei (strain ATCC 49306 / DSM 6799 / DCB-1) TaxID=706587 RepID=I4C474_DESTA|nr:sigma-54 dependent transcriptional regulator [Desulfomonile tiedjei]AFM24365.1 response regulator with CheY-like receiver, AAA-type ATPase, and DNA-binding domains [Desulfomonile tiedjei DSM 6799]
MGTIVIVDDDAQLRHSFEKLLTSEGHVVRTSATGETGLELIKAKLPDLVIMDVRLPGMDGLETFRAMHDIEPKLPVIIMTAYGSTDTAIEATKLGAYDYVLKPFEIPEMLNTIEKALEAGRFMRSRVSVDATAVNDSSDAILGRSKAMQEVFKAIGRVASTDATVLIRGESGTGKELVARAIYQHGIRSDKPFLVINCVAIPETLLESELFGYEKGAFTGAVTRRVGKIEQANGGTVFLDEIGDMPFSIQAKILRLLQEKSIERLGGRAPIPVDVRVIAATNRDLEAALAEGRFREDLYYRLKVVTLRLPPLRDRSGDTIVLADYFLKKYASEMNVNSPGVTAEAKTILNNYAWPGNVRELGNTMQKALIFSRGAPISAEEISQAIKGETARREPIQSSEDEPIRDWVRKVLALGGGEKTFNDLIDKFAELLITEALNLTSGNRSQAAKLLGLSRPTLLARIEKYGIKIETAIRSE